MVLSSKQLECAGESGAARFFALACGLFLYLAGAVSLCADGTQPLVAVHDSEYTRALENQNASGATPTGAGTTGKQWWFTDWHYFTIAEGVKEALRSDGTRFAVVGDSNIVAGGLLTNGVPRYPIVISLASEAIHDSQIAQFTNYVAAGGFLFIGSSAFTRQTNGTTRGDFAFANEMGIHMLVPGVTNFANNSTYTRTGTHRINNHIPTGTLTWRLPSASEEIPYGYTETPSQPHNNSQALLPHDVWQVVNSNATVIAQGDTTPFLVVKQYGNGYFIYCSALQPLLGNGGWAPTMYTYLTLRRSIEWAFENANLPVAKLSPWPYPYDAAFMVRHDLESFSNEIALVEASAQFEFTNGCTGDYYFCTGTLREDMSPTFNTNTVVAGLRRAMTNYGATIGPHNGGLTNARAVVNPSNYDYWHWGPDEMLDITPAGYPSGSNYAYVSLSRSFQDIESWLSGLMTNGMRVWCAPYYNGTREGSLNIQSQLGVKITGEQKIAPFPHWSISTQTPDKRFSILQQPPSDWFVGPNISHSMEAGHTTGTIRAGVDFYYSIGALVNFYTHSLSQGVGSAGPQASEYVTYSMNTNRFPRLWSANAIKIYNWWVQRSNIQVTASSATNGLQQQITFTIKNSTSTNTTVELFVPATSLFCDLKVYTNGTLAGTNVYRTASQNIKLRVGNTVTNALITYYPLGPSLTFSAENFDGTSAPALPAGWTTTGSNAPAWVTQTSVADSSPNAVFAASVGNVAQNFIVSPAFTLPTGQSQISFRHNYDLEAGVGGVAYDAAVLELKIGTNAFADVISLGGAFVSGGYTHTVDPGLGSPLAGRQAWSGTSSNFVTTVVSLPPLSSGQTVQFRWRCASDSGGNRTGWWVDNMTLGGQVCLCCAGGTNAPVLPVQTNRTVVEYNTLIVTNAATDADFGDTLFYSLRNPPAGAVVSSEGVIIWTPGGAFGGTTNTITTVVTDGAGLTATNSFNVAVINSNGPPALPMQTNRTINELTALSVTNTATDPDLPADTFTYSLLAAPSGANISSAGVITWTPSEAQGPSTNTFTIRVVDNGVPPLSATNSFTVTVNEVNSAPSLSPQGDRSVDELNTLTVTNAATDGDVPANTVTYQLLNPPAGATINSSGIITWTPAGTQGPSTNLIRTVATDNGVPSLSTTNSFNVVVNDTASCQNTQFLAQGFEVISGLPNLPSGWISTNDGAQAVWITQNAVSDTGTNAAFAAETNAVGNSYLVSPNLVFQSDTATLTFRHSYDLEAENSTLGYDGGVLEIKIGAGNFTDIVTAGGSFVTGGYTHTISGGFSSPISNRAAWSGNSGGFVTTTVNLPTSVYGQTCQLRWRCATDAAMGGNGWYVDNITISNLVCSNGNSNSAPVLPAQTNRTIAELTLLTVTNTASDADLPPNALTYQLISPPSGAAISSSGVITWTPSEAQGPVTNTITTVVADNGAPALSATNSFTVTVTEVNIAPLLPAQTNRTIAELTLLTVTNAATDADLPANALTYQLISPPSGATISAGGVITWAPTEAQGPVTNTLTTVVSDGALSATNSFTVTVTEVNLAPTLPAQTNRTIAELTLLTVTNTASDADLPANTLTYQLLSPPSGATISASGVITWTPTEAQGPVTNTLTTVVSDGSLSATNSFTVTVTEVNVAPVLPVQTNRTIAELSLLTVTNTASDADLPANTLTYQLISPPSGAAISASGVITWTPTEAQGPVTNTLTTVVSDGSLSATNSFTVTVTEVNLAPVLPAQTNRTIAELTLLAVTNTATDADVPANTLTYQLISPPSGAAISAGGVITWAPTEAQGPVTNTLTTVVSDGALSATNSFTVTVTEVNLAPALPVQTNRTIAELTLLTVTNTATDADLPANTLTYQLISPPSGAAISASGVITWTPTEAQGPATNTLTTVVSDGSLSATNSFTVMVTEVNLAPVLPAQTNRTIAELSLLAVTNTATDADVPANSLAYQLISPPSGATISAGGVITWTPTEAQGPMTNTLITVVSDGALSATNSFTVTVTEVNLAPVLPGQTNQTIAELTLLTVTNAATDADLPANTLAYQLVNPPSGAVISSSGVITWTPTEAQGPTTNTFTTIVNDGDLSATNSFVVTVTEVNLAPGLPAQTNRTISELTLLTVTNTATDADLPANILTYQMLNPPGNAAISASGVITWTPGEAEGPGTNTLTTVVSDGVASTTNSFTVTVTEVNVAPALPVQSNRTIAELTTLIVTNTATDTDLPANVLTYQLLGAPAGAAIDANGVITWTPTIAQGPATNTITTVVNDGSASATNSFVVAVTEVNQAPVLPVQINRTVAELTQLAVTNTATDADIPANVLTYQLLNAPGGASITTDGVIVWTPTEAQGPGTNTITTAVSDGSVSETNSFVVTVTEVNEAPSLPAQTNRTIGELVALTVTNAASDADLPANTLTYQLLTPPAGAWISAAGVIRWIPAVTQGPSTNTFTTVASDGTASATNSFAVTVNDTLAGTTTNLTLISTGAVWNYLDNGSDQGSAWPALGFNDAGWSNGPAQLGYGDGDEQTVVSFGTNTSAKYITTYFRQAINIANPAGFSSLNLRVLRDDGVVVYLNGVEVYRDNMPAGSVNYQTRAVSNVSGVNETTFFSGQVDPGLLVTGTNIVAVEVHQDLPTSSDLSFDLELTGVLNVIPPVLPVQSDRTIAELTTLTVTNTAFDSDSPASSLTYQLINAPAGAVIDANGVITWTPTEPQGPATNSITTVVSDGTASATNSFVVVVNEANVAPVFAGTPSNQTVAELAVLTATNNATDADLPANLLSYQLLNAPGGANITSDGVITWSPTEAQGPATNTITTVVSDGALSATNSFTVVVTEVNVPPLLPAQTNRTVAELTLLTVTNTATDPDVPANVLSYQLVNPPAGLSITANGVITWTPTEAQGPATNTITTVVSDGTANATNSFLVIVTEQNLPPVLPTQTNRTIAELTLLTITNTATDSDLPANALTYQLLNPPSGAVIDANGVITWPPTEAQGPGTNTITTVVSDGVASATNSFAVTITEVNIAPTLPAQTNRTVAELTLLTVTNTATDADLPANTLTYQLLNAPGGAVISGSGIITWTPGETQGPATNTLTTVVSDGDLSATNSFAVVVTEVNVAPVLPAQTNRTIAELTLLTVTNTASDADLPANVLSYQLLNAPAGAAIDANGVITWTPTEAQGPATNTITTVVSDGGLSATNGFTVTVMEVNIAPTLPTQTNRTIVELTLLTVTNTATDADVPANALSYQLLNAPAGALIDSNGVITWTPTEAQGPVTNTLTTVVSDGTASVTNEFVVTVTEVNVAPSFVLTPADTSLAELTQLTVTNRATDADLPANTLTYSLLNAPAGVVVDANGVITWTPTETQGPGTNTITTVVSDGFANATNSFVVIVTELNQPAVLPVQTNRTIAELTLLTVTNTATDADLPANTLTYQLLNAPSGAVISASGVITWTPGEAQGPTTNTLTTVVSDGTSSATNSFTVTVTEVNVAPVLPGQTNRTVAELTLLTVTNTASDSDLPANVLSYQLLNAPAGAVIDANGVITWTPTEAQGPATNIITTVVSDGALSATNSFTVAVSEENVAPVLPAQTNRIIAELTLLTVTNTATDADLPANALGYQLINPPAGAVIDANGVITWTPTEAQGPGTNTLITVVNDGTASVTNSFVVAVTEVNQPPALPVQTNRSIAELILLTVTNTASDADLPANGLSYQLINPPAGAVIDANGVVTWTPTEAQGPTTNILVTVASDGSASVTNNFQVIVTEVNTAPVFVQNPSEQVTPELVTLTVTNAATDSDLPANTLNYSLVDAPVGAAIDEQGVFTWRPKENQGPSTNVIVTVVNDGSVSVTNSFVVMVTEVNSPPLLSTIVNRTIHTGSILLLLCLAQDSNGETNSLIFSFDVAPAGAEINATNGQCHWLTTDADANTTNAFIVRVTDDGEPPLSDTKSFTVTVVARPMIQDISLTNELVTVSWSAIAGQHYILQGSTALSPTNWSDVGGEVISAGVTASQTNSAAGTPAQFYRVRLAP